MEIKLKKIKEVPIRETGGVKKQNSGMEKCLTQRGGKK